MARRSLTATMLAIIAVQLLGTMALAPVCLEPCPDDENGASCPPVCTFCTNCTHAQQAIVQLAASCAPSMTAQQVILQRTTSNSSQLAADVFHVPLLG